MPGIVAPGICRFTVNGTFAGREIANIVDMRIDTTGSTMSRQDAIEDQAAVLVSAWADHVLDVLSNNYVADSVSWVDLDDVDGTVGETSVGTGTDFPAAGVGTSPTMPGNVAYRINKSITAARGQRQGRMYLVGAAEDATTDGEPNTVQASTRGAINTAMAAFLAAMNQDGDATQYDSRMVVIHTTSDENPDPPPKLLVTYQGFSEISALICDATLASQRRRLRG